VTPWWFVAACVAFLAAIAEGLFATMRARSAQSTTAHLFVACLLCVVFGMCMAMGMEGHL
jgi:hypothetical protein